MLNIKWKPEFGLIYTWFASDCEGRIAVFVNNNFGDIPKIILGINDIESKLDAINEFILEESLNYKNQYFRKNGGTQLNFYSSLRYRDYSSATQIKDLIKSRLASNSITEFTIPAYKGIYVYHALEGDRPGMDYPVGLDLELHMGDYFKFLSPTIFANINEFPLELTGYIAKTNSVKFSDLSSIRNSDLNIIFNSI